MSIFLANPLSVSSKADLISSATEIVYEMQEIIVWIFCANTFKISSTACGIPSPKWERFANPFVLFSIISSNEFTSSAPLVPNFVYMFAWGHIFPYFPSEAILCILISASIFKAFEFIPFSLEVIAPWLNTFPALSK